MPRGTPENLQPVRSKSEARERGRKGGIASGIARREKAARKIRIKEIAELAVDKAILPEYIQNMDGQADFATVVDLRLFELCKQGNIAAMKLWYELYGTDPVLQQRIREVDLKHKQFEFEKEKWKAEKDTQGAAYSDIIEYFSRICEADDDGSVRTGCSGNSTDS